MDNFLLHIAVSILGAGGLAAFFIFRTRRKGLAFAALAVFIAAVTYFWFSGEDILDRITGWLSILGSGTASLSAILYLISMFFPRLRGEIFKSFLLLFKIIWVGVGGIAIFNIISWPNIVLAMKVGELLPGFFFYQALFAIITLNGFYIGKRIGFGLVQLLKQVPAPAPDKALATRIAASGSISIVSWYGMVAGAKGLLEGRTLGELFGLYFALIIAVFVINMMLEQIRKLIYERPH